MKKTRTVIQTMITLAAASLGLVAALAWNDAVQALIRRAPGEGDSLAGLFVYAAPATVAAAVVPLILANAAARVGGEAATNREAEG